ncbi:MAG: uroporphyrinogen-III synthase [Pseudomonadota bacterium]
MGNNDKTRVDLPVLVMTRPEASAQRFVAGLPRKIQESARIIYSPLIDICGTSPQIDVDRCSGAVFTSANGVRHGPKGHGRAALCVGQMTASLAADRGWDVRQVALTADSLIDEMNQSLAGPLVHFSGRYHRGDVAERLTALGLETSRVTVYEQLPRPLTAEADHALAGETSVLLPLFSPRTAKHFAEQVRALNKVIAVFMSPAVAQMGVGLGFAERHVLARPTAQLMRQTVERLVIENSLP